jgi:hypothetical protein
VSYSSSLEHTPHQKDKGIRRSATSSSLERLTPRQFLDKYSLPRVVRVVTPTGENGNNEKELEQRRALLGPLAKPLLLYRQYKSTKVQARSLQTAKLWKTVGPSLVIPDSYQGEYQSVLYACNGAGLASSVSHSQHCKFCFGTEM